MLMPNIPLYAGSVIELDTLRLQGKLLPYTRQKPNNFYYSCLLVRIAKALKLLRITS